LNGDHQTNAKMKRLVNYDDGDDSGEEGSNTAWRPQPPPPNQGRQVAAPQDLPQATRSKNDSAKEIFIENQAFDRAYHQALRGQSSTVSKPVPKAKERPELVDPGEAMRDGPWAPVREEEITVVKSYKNTVSSGAVEDVEKRASASEQLTFEDADNSTSVGEFRIHSERHASEEVDYQGRSVTDARRWPPALDFFPEDQEEDEYEDEEIIKQAASMVRARPHKKGRKKETRLSGELTLKREYRGHSKGITRLRLSGCLALTAGIDGAVMLWDTSMPDDVAGATKSGLADDRGAIQTYWGHNARAVRDCAFPNHSATSFVSCGYDGQGLLWDTDRGVVLSRFKADNPNVPVNAARFKTDDDNQLILGFGDRKLRQWDVREPSDKPTQTYDFHQGSVSSVLFCEGGNKFVSTGEDRKLLVWEWNVPTPVKTISELWIPGMPTTAAHPSTMSFVAVGLDNKLFQFKIDRRTGVVKKDGVCVPDDLNVAGYACEPGFSPCGSYLAVGDGSGTIHLLRPGGAFKDNGGDAYVTQKIRGAHQSRMPVTSVGFHPCFEGVLLSVSWDGFMKWWS
jgi:pre-mRNA-processing factor 17